ncbi:MAG: D-alanyl-D-alanine carboxypeptidase [Clostridia bacterium]|nr:D-alanyl-D-alanine carboxypeptidase [Clostridia bacterium]
MFTKRLLAVIITAITLFSLSLNTFATGMQFDAKSYLLMEASTGRVLLEENADAPLPPASVTKIMTLLLVMEAIEDGKIKLEDMVSVSNNAASMGGSQVYLEPGETMSVDEMIKCVVVSSANDAALALAEHVAGSEEIFVDRMNQRAKELGMQNTKFENTNGLDDTTTEHLTSARDIAIMSRELIRHPKILEYSSIWMDTVRGGEFTLTNTNRLIRFYNGANGLKTGSTSRAGFCISATALRDGMQLIAVVMGSPNRDTRNEIAKKLLDYGFAGYAVAGFKAGELEPIRLLGGISKEVKLGYSDFSCVVEKGRQENIEKSITLPENVTAPVKKGDIVGKISYILDGSELGSVDIVSLENADKIGYFGVLGRILKNLVLI